MIPPREIILPDEEEPEIPDPVINMRFERLLKAGYEANHALELATNRSIDLHKAEDLARASSPDLAFQILS